LPADDDIPIGQYGRSNLGRAKTVYRQGLAHRYGRRMQTISGVHYNVSMPESAWPVLQRADGQGGPASAYQNDAYFHLIRNFKRHSWLLLYLFGASPTVCRSFVAGRTHRLRDLSPGTLFLPGATSLRMGPLGYQSDAQASLAVSFNSLKSYANSLNRALTKPYPPYEAIGLREGDGYRQLATTLLQIENEFYGTIRPKPHFYSGERPLYALGERGVEYIEVRMDNDAFSPVGIAAATIRFGIFCFIACSATAPECRRRLPRSPQSAPRRRERDPITPGAWDRSQPGRMGSRPGGRVRIAAALMMLTTQRIRERARPQAPPSRRSASPLRPTCLRNGSDYDNPMSASLGSVGTHGALLDLPWRQNGSRYAFIAARRAAAQRRIEAADRVPFETYCQNIFPQPARRRAAPPQNWGNRKMHIGAGDGMNAVRKNRLEWTKLT
jgi:glutamate--cysteine ligase